MNTVAALLTPAGKGALAVVGVRGPAAWQVARETFAPRSEDLALQPGRWWLGRVVGDDAVLAVRGAESIEFQIHGGREVSRQLLDLLAWRGVGVIGWEEFVRLEDGDDRAEALLALARATTGRTAAILLDQYHGAFRREMDDARAGASDVALSLGRRIALGSRLTTPFRVVVAGEPNVGKSSLVNALAGYARAIVSPTPGTTRDVVSTALAIDGWPVELLDTAGLRHAGDALEAAGVEEARRAIAEADLVLWVVDASEARSVSEGSGRVVVNKIDLPPAWDLASVGDAPRVSAATGEGIDALCGRISGWLVPDPPPPGAGVPITARQVAEVRSLFDEV